LTQELAILNNVWSMYVTKHHMYDLFNFSLAKFVLQLINI